MYCEGCGVRLESGVRFCGACGTVAPGPVAARAACACGAALEPGARFCEQCGLLVLAPARPVAGGVSDARLAAPAEAALPIAGARVLGPSRLVKRQARLQEQSAAARAAAEPDDSTSVTANVPINILPASPPAAAGEAPAVPAVSMRGGPRVQVAGTEPSSKGPSPLALGVIFVGSFLAVTAGLVVAYSRTLPGSPPANGARGASGPDAVARVNSVPARGEMLRDVRVLQIAAGHRSPGHTASLSFDEAGDLVAACSRDGALRIWSIVSEKETRLPRGSLGPGTVVSGTAFARDDSFLAVAEVGPPSQVSVVWLSGKKSPLRIPTSAPPVAIGTLSGRRVRVVTLEGSVQTWNVRSGEAESSERLLPWNEDDGLPEVVTLSRDGAWLARASGSGADVWNVERGGLPRRVEMPGRPSSLAFRGDGRNLAAAVSGEIGIWDFVSGERQRSFEGHRYSVSAVAFSPDGALLGSVAESEVAVWDAISGRRRDRRTLPGETFRSVGFNAPGKWLGAGSDDRIRLYRFR